ncbi:MAG TPA: flagellar biosynthesis protein FlhB [Pseudothermotoga sp.]|nr:flagellar biosynthesis protein FlhB [Pseudothermotoga sp.]HOK84187.1 flagellar biosynthesis protein FlhB [Pseudothermotoga sp.]HPP69187.1 flagellar biosynthesis protein FlhB [Pseudothermotoga sp.]
MGRCLLTDCEQDLEFSGVLRSGVFKIDLQLFADPERTEKPTPRRRRKAREEGQVAVSRELNMAVSFLAGTIIMRFVVYRIIDFSLSGSIPFLYLDDFDSLENISSRIYHMFRDTILMLIVLFFSIALSAIVIGALQTRFLLSFKPLKADLKRINPVEGFKRMFSTRSLFELLKSIFKMVIVGYVAYTVIRPKFNSFSLYSDMEVNESMRFVFDTAYEVMFKCSIALLVLAIVDYFYQRWEFEKSIRMTKQELKEEYREVEGSPEVKRRQREIMARLSRGRMLQQVPQADVVITNPTHIAVALKYDSEEMEAPVVLAKGADEVAQKIVQIARQSGVPVVQNPEVARQLYKTTDIGEQIPAGLYRAVAEILAYVYSLR